MSIVEKQNFQTSQDSKSVEYPLNEKEVSIFIKKFYKSNIPLEILGSGSKKNRQITSMWKNFKFIKVKRHCRILA